MEKLTREHAIERVGEENVIAAEKSIDNNHPYKDGNVYKYLSNHKCQDNQGNDMILRAVLIIQKGKNEDLQLECPINHYELVPLKDRDKPCSHKP